MVGGAGNTVRWGGRSVRRLADKMHVLGLPAEADAGAAAGQALPLGLVGVGDEDGHPHPLAEVDGDLGRGTEVERAGDDALDMRLAPAAVAAFAELDPELLRPHNRVAAIAGREAV